MHQVQRAPRWVVRRSAARLLLDGPANRVTSVRAVLTAVVAVLAVRLLVHESAPVRHVVVALAGLALLLDLVDGQVARRTGTVSSFGARFDMETDAALVLVLSTLLVAPVGWWLLLIGLARYLLLGAQWLWPWLRGPIAPRRWRKVVAAVQGVALLVGVADLLPRPTTSWLLATALGLLVLSFGTEVVERVRRTSRSDRRAGAGRRARLVTGGAVVLVWVGLDMPDRLADVTVWQLLRVPLDGLALVVLVLVLPALVGRSVAVLAGLAVFALAGLRLLDLGFAVVLDRSFSVVADWGYLGSGVGVLDDSLGGAGTTAVVALLAAGLLLLALALPLAALRVAAAARRRPRAALSSVAVLAAAASLLTVVGVRPAADGSLASAGTTSFAVDEVARVRDELHDRTVFARKIIEDRFAGVPADRLLAGLRGRDVLLVFVESYGRVAVEGTSYSRGVDRVLARGTRQLGRAGYGARSAWLTSPTFGAGSWLAHASVQSGLWVGSQGRYDQLLATNRRTLTSTFGEAGWRTVLDAPADTRDWPEGRAFYRPTAMYDSRNVGYQGPAFGYAPIPDQYTLSWLAAHELTAGDRPPVMAELDLVSSHHPWAPLPRHVPWGQVGDGSVFDGMPAQGDSATKVFADPDRVRAAYGASIEYSLRTLFGFLRRLQHQDPDLVVLMMGDHQPHSYVTGSRPGHQVPVSLISRDRSVLRRIAGWHWQPGLRPGAAAPVWGMHSVRGHVFEAFRGPSR